uniref:phosphoglycolate phosphatase n=1 Tax=Salix viminalis TaxID=40686 RepID=A0A6N2K0Z7_SALVM
MNTAKRAAQLLSTQNIRSLFDSVEAFLFDCDGVIWKGDKLIDGVSETLDWLRSKGKKLVFVTNNSLKSRIQYAKKFHSLGISVAEDEIFSSSFAAAMYLKVNNFPQEKKVYVIGGEGILEELQIAGFTGLGGPEDGEKRVELKPNSLFEHDKSVGAVVVGIDPRINYYKLQYGTLCIRENPGCLFIATNRDAVGHMTDLQEWPGAGSMVAAMCGSTEREPIVVGKPSTFMMDFLLEKFHINTSKMCMVGDRLDTDILFGQNAGCKTLLVLSGVTTQTTLQDPSNNVQPDYYTSQAVFMEAVAELSAASIYFLEAIVAAFPNRFPIFLAPSPALSKLSSSLLAMRSISSSNLLNSSMALSMSDSRYSSASCTATSASSTSFSCSSSIAAHDLYASISKSFMTSSVEEGSKFLSWKAWLESKAKMKFNKATKMLVIVTIIALLIASAAAGRGSHGGGGSRGGSSAALSPALSKLSSSLLAMRSISSSNLLNSSMALSMSDSRYSSASCTATSASSTSFSCSSSIAAHDLYASISKSFMTSSVEEGSKFLSWQAWLESKDARSQILWFVNSKVIYNCKRDTRLN